MKTLCVLLKGMPEPVKLEIDRYIDDDNELTLTAFNAKGEKIGYFNKNEMAGFWTEK
jgi:hypothetical protein